MNWLFKFFPLRILISMLLNAIKEHITSKTKTKIDDMAIECLENLLGIWSPFLDNPSDSVLQVNIQQSILDLLEYGAKTTKFEWDDQFIENLKIFMMSVNEGSK